MAKDVKPPTDEEYDRARINVAMGFAPNIYACKKCHWPVADGYCCGTCGDPNPYNTRQQDAEFEALCEANRKRHKK